MTEDKMDCRLAPHFTLAEMTASGEAVKHGISNVPNKEQTERLRMLCNNVLEPLRRKFGRIIITSGYRCNQLNDVVRGVKNSQHLLGEAADIHISNMTAGRRMFSFLRDNTDFDQLLFEHVRRSGVCWLHVSYHHGANRHYAHDIFK